MAWFRTSWKKAAGSNNVFRPDSEICRDVNVFGFWRPTSSFHFSRADNSSALWLNCFHGNLSGIIGRNGQILQQQDIFVTCQKLPYFVITNPLRTENLLLDFATECSDFRIISQNTRELHDLYQHSFSITSSSETKQKRWPLIFHARSGIAWIEKMKSTWKIPFLHLDLKQQAPSCCVLLWYIFPF